MIAYRRRKYLLRELASSVSSVAKNVFTRMYHFGSQKEGTSTPEMGSDLDTLQYGDFENVFLNTKNWVPGKFNMRLCILPDTPSTAL